MGDGRLPAKARGRRITLTRWTMDSAACAASVRDWTNAIPAVLAIGAAAAWFIATRHPVAKPGLPFYAPADRNHPFWERLAKAGRRIDAGAGWNTWAALLAGLSAIAGLLSLMLPKLVCN
jgi:hypothetical protein